MTRKIKTSSNLQPLSHRRTSRNISLMDTSHYNKLIISRFFKPRKKKKAE